jgi:fatty acid desaturase
MTADLYEYSAPLVTTDRAAARQRPAVDWPTVAVGIGVYSSFALLTWFHNALPWWLVLPLGGYIIGLHGSLQHEAVHGYPFRSRFWNSAFVFPSLWLWLPYTHYRHTHLKHHRNERLTSPADDPESVYVTAAAHAHMNRFHCAYRLAMTTVAGRLILGPPYFVARVWLEMLRRLRTGDWAYMRHWAIQVPAAGIVLLWVVAVCDIPLWQYALLYTWPGLSLTVLRSYLEHQWAADVGHRTVIIEAGPIMGLLYLHNNLHALHHLEPATAWHQRPRRFRERRDDILAGNGGYRYRGYAEVVARYLIRPKEPLVHPMGNL